MTFGPTSSALDCFVIFDWFFEKLFKLKFGYEDGKSHGSREREGFYSVLTISPCINNCASQHPKSVDLCLLDIKVS